MIEKKILKLWWSKLRAIRRKLIIWLERRRVVKNVNINIETLTPELLSSERKNPLREISKQKKNKKMRDLKNFMIMMLMMMLMSMLMTLMKTMAALGDELMAFVAKIFKIMIRKQLKV
ncbi:hypothetical protein M8J75_004757 [Diaphorina citri]|nr:hypothetical protein M8J75_004757 [Diaphorina citri]KAI5735230.1 hypothetical protein M8J77_015851 [Diaphorina citri]